MSSDERKGWVILVLTGVFVGVLLGIWVERQDPVIIKSPPEIKVVEVPTPCNPQIIYLPCFRDSRFSTCIDLGGGITSCMEN